MFDFGGKLFSRSTPVYYSMYSVYSVKMAERSEGGEGNLRRKRADSKVASLVKYHTLLEKTILCYQVMDRGRKKMKLKFLSLSLFFLHFLSSGSSDRSSSSFHY